MRLAVASILAIALNTTAAIAQAPLHGSPEEAAELRRQHQQRLRQIQEDEELQKARIDSWRRMEEYRRSQQQTRPNPPIYQPPAVVQRPQNVPSNLPPECQAFPAMCSAYGR